MDELLFRLKDVGADTSDHSFSGHFVNVRYQLKSGEGDDVAIRELRQILPVTRAGRDGEWVARLRIPSGAELNDLDVAITGPSGKTLFREHAFLETARSEEPIPVEPEPAIGLQSTGRTDRNHPRRLSGRALDLERNKAVKGERITLLAKKTGDAEATPIFSAVSDSDGYFYGDYPQGEFAEAHGVVGEGGSPIPVILEDGKFPETVVLGAERVIATESCCDETPRIPSSDDLVNSPTAFSADPDPSRCVDFRHMPDRTLQEVRFYTAVRLTQPQIQLLGGARPPSDDHYIPEHYESHTGLPEGEITRHDPRRHPGLRAPRLDPTLANVEPFYDAEAVDHPGRLVLQGQAAIDWERSDLYRYQATTISHGHLLCYRQTWHADGYSLGNLLYSLPLAPCQKKRIAIVDWGRQERASRSETLRVSEQLSADLIRDRDIREALSSLLTEDREGGASSNTWSVGASGGINFFGMASIGVSGGYSSSTASAWEQSARSLGSNFSNTLRDRTMQAQAAVRELRSTVIHTVGQDEDVRVETEVIANHNHCHALTMQYFEVLRHFVIKQELAGVEECLFVPLRLLYFPHSRSDDQLLAVGLRRALKWESRLRPALTARGWREAGDTFREVREFLGELEDGEEGTPIADQPFSDVVGELELEFRIPMPYEGGSDYYAAVERARALRLGPDMEAKYRQFAQYLHILSINESAEGNIKLAAEAEKFFQEHIAPVLAERFVEKIRLRIDQNDVAAHAALMSTYRPGRPLRVALIASEVNALKRSSVERVELTVDAPKELDLSFYDGEVPENAQPHQSRWLPGGAQVLIRGGSIKYRTIDSGRAFTLARPKGGDLQNVGADGVLLPLVPETSQETRNPQEIRRKLAHRLLSHLNAHIVHYHQAIWSRMDDGERYLLLDAFEAPNGDGRSIAQVVRNEVIGIVGNSLIMPIAPGVRLNPLFNYPEDGDANELLKDHYAPIAPPPPVRFAIPTRGVFGEAVMGHCNACEKKDDSRFWKWHEAPCGDEPPSIAEVSAASRRAEPESTDPSTLPNPIVNIQNAPSAPEPTGLGVGVDAVTRSDAFGDLGGLSGAQQAAAKGLSGALGQARLAQHTVANLDKLMSGIDQAVSRGQLSEEDAQGLTKKFFEAASGAARNTPTAIEDIADRFADYVEKGSKGSLKVDTPDGSIQFAPSDIPAGDDDGASAGPERRRLKHPQSRFWLADNSGVPNISSWQLYPMGSSPISVGLPPAGSAAERFVRAWEGSSKRIFDHVDKLDGLTFGFPHWPQHSLAARMQEIIDHSAETGDPIWELFVFRAHQSLDFAKEKHWKKLYREAAIGADDVEWAGLEEKNLDFQLVGLALEKTLANEEWVGKFSDSRAGNEGVLAKNEWVRVVLVKALRDARVAEFQYIRWAEKILGDAQAAADDMGLTTDAATFGMAGLRSNRGRGGIAEFKRLASSNALKLTRYVNGNEVVPEWDWNSLPDDLQDSVDAGTISEADALQDWRALILWQWIRAKDAARNADDDDADDFPRIRGRMRAAWDVFYGQAWEVPGNENTDPIDRLDRSDLDASLIHRGTPMSQGRVFDAVVEGQINDFNNNAAGHSLP